MMDFENIAQFCSDPVNFSVSRDSRQGITLNPALFTTPQPNIQELTKSSIYFPNILPTSADLKSRLYRKVQQKLATQTRVTL